jgi:hypothetical protein
MFDSNSIWPWTRTPASPLAFKGSFTAGHEQIHFRDVLGSQQVMPSGKSRPTNKVQAAMLST